MMMMMLIIIIIIIIILHNQMLALKALVNIVFDRFKKS